MENNEEEKKKKIIDHVKLNFNILLTRRKKKEVEEKLKPKF